MSDLARHVSKLLRKLRVTRLRGEASLDKLVRTAIQVQLGRIDGIYRYERNVHKIESLTSAYSHLRDVIQQE